MKWEGEEQSSQVEDRRDSGGGRRLGGGVPLGGGRGLGLGGIAVALVAAWIFGINPLTVLNMLAGGGAPALEAPAPASPRAAKDPGEDRAAAFAKVVLRDTEKVWIEIYREAGGRYEMPVMVLYRGATPTGGCGQGEAAMGPFYCPADRKVYLDLGFFDVMARRLGAPGDFAQAYVIAHEVGHHVQNLMGVSEKVDAQRRRLSEVQGNALSVKVELQADCLAGVWAHRSQQGKGWLEAGDLEEALNAAAQIGDDTLQRASNGQVVPERFTHGSSAQRVAWFKRGFEGGDVQQCNTFAARGGNAG